MRAPESERMIRDVNPLEGHSVASLGSGQLNLLFRYICENRYVADNSGTPDIVELDQERDDMYLREAILVWNS